MEQKLQSLKQSFFHAHTHPPHLCALQATSQSVSVAFYSCTAWLNVKAFQTETVLRTTVWTGCTAYCQDVGSG